MRTKIVIFFLICFSHVAVCQRYYHYDVGLNMAMPNAEIDTKGKPGFYFGFGLIRELSEHVFLKTGSKLGFYRYDIGGYQLNYSNGLFFDNINVSPIQVKQTSVVFNYDLMMCLSLFDNKLAIYGGINAGIFPLVKTQDFNSLIFTNHTFTANQTYTQSDLENVKYLDDPLFDGKNFMIGPKFGIGYALTRKLEINIEYLMFLNSLYSDDSEDISAAIGNFKLNIFQTGIIYKLKPSPERLRF